MGEQGFGVVEEALETYAGRVPGLADELGKVGSSTLNGVTSLPADCFGKLGQEVGLHGAFQKAAQSQVDGLKAVSEGLDGLAGAVRGALGSYRQQDADTAQAMTRAGRV
ncbi:Protein of unknown function (DUF2580) [Streptoalloteichus tenebrarius]|uniref:ESX-1 secretion-associated protein n=1 Tax=Streptoalloteichus tenebrarius (strain ATCC 17920 / DSM 40477 / JCM 4838 / CBS 697.72 / NBRC 16177 / NCIMB 11028 / NRRL B-12390 / A12253. 1 / ISP 5477) TaxID=1933 RepID=A0ABT1HY84_STRSD|nr:hypothetical protein [Streptoalloteichus tenebrarius]MCP2260479.1 Protein of unknown function (DUF2580) [Streptoalloteichus tenebrarius]BFF02725.1 hypothetical protein GCM10020241_44000 [Streptoalloteichus tenebrarius]